MADKVASSARPPGASMVRAKTRSSPSKTDNLTVLEPAFTTRRRMAVGLIGPRPVADLGVVFALEPGVSPGLDPGISHLLA